ncbi:MBL fold metallo-hydrolase [Pseudonocardia sp.]|uniref:MBL fold metallo-hydrolase n=1 Tax=Pseudonocardia sp. TaxID=60912 RepID=UPI002D7F5FE3|nr:MBL fold metallo-hydrolase [Pseudonocardia sp.]
MTATLGRLSDQSAVRTRQLDDLTLTYVVDGSMAMNKEEFLASIPASYWADHPDAVTADGRVAMSCGGLLVQRGDHHVLIDAGYGPARETTPWAEINCGAMLETLAALGHTPADIDVLALTHLHVDHTGWAFITNPGQPPQQTFPNASYLVSAEELAPHEHGINPPGSSPLEQIEPLEKICTTFADAEEVAPGIVTVVTPGHSAGHTSYVVTSARGRRVVAFGDAFHIPAQLTNPGWNSAPDVDTERVLIARARITAELEQPDTIGFGFHFGDQAFGRITRDDARMPTWTPVPAAAVMPTPRPFG